MLCGLVRAEPQMGTNLVKLFSLCLYLTSDTHVLTSQQSLGISQASDRPLREQINRLRRTSVTAMRTC